jgi:tRNA G26 N,N-dimethylase Trm1
LKTNKIKKLMKKGIIMQKIRKAGYEASDTHFKGEGIRSDVPPAKLAKILQNK